MKSPIRIGFDEIEWESPAPGLRVKARETGDQRLRLVEFSEGFVEPDWCTKGHTGYVLDGAMELDVDGQTITLRAGDALHIPAGDATRHRHIRSLPQVVLFLVEPF